MGITYHHESESTESSKQPRSIRKRLPADRSGYICDVPDCGKAFNRRSELSKHQKYHQPKQDRPLVCAYCENRFLFPKDLKRHVQTVHWDVVSTQPAATLAVHMNSAQHHLQPGASSEPLALPSTRAEGVENVWSLNSSSTTNAVPDIQELHSQQLELSPLVQHRSTATPAVPRHLFSYVSFDSNDSIRLLSLLPGHPSEELRCTLTQHKLSDAVNQYEALSYTWGDDIGNASILVDGQCLKIRSNLMQCLRCLRTVENSRTLWVDAVCINQHDIHEKNNQVAMMAKVYSNATNVCVWLGEHEDGSERAFRFIRHTASDLGAFEEITTKKFFEDWKALAALMNRDWFNRRWAVQEISHATTATVHCGPDLVSWTDFETAVSLFEQDAPRISKIFRSDEKAEFGYEFFGYPEAMGATRLVQAKSKLFRRDDDNKIVEYRFPLSELVTELASFEAKNPHDMIYAVLSLAKDTWHKTVAKSESSLESAVPADGKPTATTGRKRSLAAANASTPIDDATTATAESSNKPPSKKARQSANGTTSFTEEETAQAELVVKVMRGRMEIAKKNHKVFQVDYNQNFFSICRQFIDFTLNCSKGGYNLDILCRPWAPKEQIDLPSWIPSAADAPFEIRPARYGPRGRQMSRKNHDPLVCQSPTGNASTTAYNACRPMTEPKWRLGDLNDAKQKNSLFISGFVIDKIGPIETYSQLGNVPPEWLELAGWYPWDRSGRRNLGSRPPERLWRTLVADRGPDGADAKIHWSKAFEYAVDHSTPHAGVETTNLAKRNIPILVEFLRRMMAVVWNRRLFKSARMGLLGLSPKSSQRNDLICILRGCSVPVVLHPHENGTDSKYYTFIGDCYFHTMMGGRAIDVREAEDLPMEMFELR